MSIASKTTQATTSSSNLPTIQRFYADDYAGAPKWFQQFISTLNLFTQQTYNIVNAGISIPLNTTEEIYSFAITAGATAAANTFRFTPRKFVGQPSGVVVGQVVVSAATVTPVGSAVTLDWIYNAGQVQIISIYGLTNGTTYSITVRIF
jgi:ethanolamine utilization microcompartment shell protein EutL